MQDLVRLTAAARAAGSRWDAIAAACGVPTYEDLAGVIYRITGETGADLLFSATQYAVWTAHRQPAPLPAADLGLPAAAASRSPTGPPAAGPSTSSTATPRAAPGWPATRPPTTNGAASRSPA